MLARFVRQQNKGLSFTAVAICQGTHSALHSEYHNEADSYSLGVPIMKVEGGQMWIEDVEGHSQCPDATCNLAGTIHELPVMFKPSSKHRSMPWVGGASARIVLVAFTPRGPQSLHHDDVQLLRELGFRVPASVNTHTSIKP